MKLSLPKSLSPPKSLAALEKIELNPNTVLLGLGGVLLVAYLVIGVSYLRGRQEQSDLRQQIEAGGGTLSGAGGSRQTLQELRDRLVQAQAELTSLENALPERLDSPGLVESLLAYAAQSNVRIREMNALLPKEVKAAGKEQGAYVALGYTLAVDGDLPDLLAFLSRIETDITQTVAVGDLSLAYLEGVQEMKVGLSFYAKPGGKQATPAAAGAPIPTPNGGEQP